MCVCRKIASKHHHQPRIFLAYTKSKQGKRRGVSTCRAKRRRNNSASTTSASSCCYSDTHAVGRPHACSTTSFRPPRPLFLLPRTRTPPAVSNINVHLSIYRPTTASNTRYKSRTPTFVCTTSITTVILYDISWLYIHTSVGSGVSVCVHCTI